MKKISALQAAKHLGVSIKNLNVLEKQGLVHPIQNTKGVSFYSSSEIAQIKSRRGLSISDEASKVNAQIQRETVSSISLFQKILRIAGGFTALYLISVIVLGILFVNYPLQTSDFFGYYYRLNLENKLLTSAPTKEKSRVLAASTGPVVAVVPNQKTSIIADLIKPAAAVSLVAVKAVDDQKYTQIVTNPVVSGSPDGLTVSGPPGANGANGAVGPQGPAGLSGTNGINGTNGTSVADVMTASGDIMIRDSGNTTSRLAAGPNGQVLTITGGIPAWADSVAGVFSGLTSGTNTTALMIVGSGASLDFTGTGMINASSLNGATFANPGAIGSSTPSTGVFTTVNGLTITNNSTNTLNIAVGKTLTVNNTVTFNGTDSTSFTLPGSSDTLVGLSTSGIFTNKTISGSTNTLSNIANSSLSNSSLTFTGNIGSGSVSLGGTLTILGSGINTAVYSGGKITVNGTESDTLQSVYERGNTIKTKTGEGIIIDSSEADVTEMVNGLKIDAPKTIPRTGIYNSLYLGTSTSPTANSYDQATIVVGNLASTAQQNFSTLNITNGGTGFLDVELIRGFINFQGMNTLYDDFTSKSLDTTDRWTSTSTGTGSNCSILAGGLNGLFRMHSGGGTNRGCELTTRAIGSLTSGYYQRGNNPIFETKVKIDTVTNARIFAGFTDTRITAASETNPSTNHAYIAKKAADTTWQCVTDNGGATETTNSTGVTIVANTFYRLRVELRSGTTPETICTIDDGTTVTRTVVIGTQPGITNPMDVYIKINQSDTVAKNMDVDYVRAWQDDPPAFALTVDGNLAPAPVASETNSVPEASAPEEAVASDSGSLATLVAGSVNSFLKNLAEFFGDVIFHGNVAFLGRPTFNKDTAGHAFIKAGSNEVGVIFEKEYVQNPVVTASVNLVDGVLMDEIPKYAIYDLSTKGFKIKLSKVATLDLNFSWVALFVGGNNESDHSILNTPILSVTPGSSPATSEVQPQAVIPSITPLPGQEIVLSPTPSDKAASPSAGTL